jgi:hypothetical protein
MVAKSHGIAAILIDGGRTVHAFFSLKIETSDTTLPNIPVHSEKASILNKNNLLTGEP